jgi:ferredoxin
VTNRRNVLVYLTALATLALKPKTLRAQGSGLYVIAEPCIGSKDASCVAVCPVDCIYEGEDQYYINPDECIDCGACESECPVQAIFASDSVPEQWEGYIAKNRDFFGS